MALEWEQTIIDASDEVARVLALGATRADIGQGEQPWVVLGADEWLTGAFEITTSGGGLAVEHGRIATSDGFLVAESFQTRLTTTA